MFCQYCGKSNDDDYCDCFDEWDDDDEYSEEDYEMDREEEEAERLAEIAGNCKCGAYVFSPQGVLHVADCCCGAE